MEREKAKLQGEERKLINEIKMTARKGDIPAVNILAKDLVRTRKHINKFNQLKSSIQAIKLRLQTVKSSQEMSKSLVGVNNIISSMNASMDVKTVEKNVREFMRENEKMENTEELMMDAMEDAFMDEGTEAAEQEEIQKVFDELSIDTSVKLQQSVANKQSIQTEADTLSVIGLEDRLNNLKK